MLTKKQKVELLQGVASGRIKAAEISHYLPEPVILAWGNDENIWIDFNGSEVITDVELTVRRTKQSQLHESRK